MMDGKHHAEILKDIVGSQHDLVVIGALGIGRARDSEIGSVCERVARQSDRDVWVVKHVPEPGEAERDTILVGIDGSPQSFGALMTAIDLARTFGKKVETIAVYDPYLHYSVFNGIVNVLTEKAAKVFRFEEQNQLHEEIIDTGLAQIYQSHLEVAERMAREAGVVVKKTLLDGKAFQKILDHARKTNPWLHRGGPDRRPQPDGRDGAGQQRREPAPLAPVRRPALHAPRSPDARRARRGDHPLDARGRGAHEARAGAGQGHRAHRRPSPGAREGALGDHQRGDRRGDGPLHAEERVGRDQGAGRGGGARAGEGRPGVDVPGCGVAATQSGAVKCTVCGATDFEVISPEMIERIADVEGGLEEETTYDGRKLRWSEDARKGLWTMKNAYQRRRAKARVEKRARMLKLDAITLEFARQVIEEETGTPLEIRRRLQPDGRRGRSRSQDQQRARRGKLIARDDKKNPLISTFDWTDGCGAADPARAGRVHAQQDAGAGRGARAGARR